jgi:hypothetical protein
MILGIASQTKATSFHNVSLEYHLMQKPRAFMDFFGEAIRCIASWPKAWVLIFLECSINSNILHSVIIEFILQNLFQNLLVRTTFQPKNRSPQNGQILSQKCLYYLNPISIFSKLGHSFKMGITCSNSPLDDHFIFFYTKHFFEPLKIVVA